MGTDALRNREIWQDTSGRNAGIAENRFFRVFSEHFMGSEFRVRKRPKEFNDLYSDVMLSEEVLAQIYTPSVTKWRHGLVPDYAIDNLRTVKTLYVEVKRQDGWVEGKSRSAGRGNAHERSCKFFTPGLLRLLRAHGKLGDSALPFWIVYQGDIARDPCRVREITYWYGEYDAHFFMWRDLADDEALIRHFDQRLRHLLV